jgi:hypothetical protein
MWQMSCGEAVLRGAEWVVFRTGLGVLVDLVTEELESGGELPCDTGVEVFDYLRADQKLAMLSLVAWALKDEAVPPPELTALTEGTVAAVYASVRDFLVCEIDAADRAESEEDRTGWRSLVLTAVNTFMEPDDWEDPPPKVTSDDVSDWEFLIECLKDRVFWDRDWEMASPFLDVDRYMRWALEGHVSVIPEYYTHLPPEPTQKELADVRRLLHGLTRAR